MLFMWRRTTYNRGEGSTWGFDVWEAVGQRELEGDLASRAGAMAVTVAPGRR